MPHNTRRDRSGVAIDRRSVDRDDHLERIKASPVEIFLGHRWLLDRGSRASRFGTSGIGSVSVRFRKDFLE